MSFLVLDIKTPFSEKREEKYGIPSLEELGLNTTSLGEELFPGGEQEALRRLDEHMTKTVLPHVRLFFSPASLRIF